MAGAEAPLKEPARERRQRRANHRWEGSGGRRPPGEWRPGKRTPRSLRLLGDPAQGPERRPPLSGGHPVRPPLKEARR